MQIRRPKPWEKPYSERFKDRLPRVAIGFLAFGDISPECFESCIYWAFYTGGKCRGRYEVTFDIAQRREQYRARNGLVNLAQQHQADFILMLDDDHTLMDCPDMIDHFFNEQKPLQGGLYVQRRGDGSLQPVIQKYNAETGDCFWCKMDEVPLEGGPVDILGGGVNWIDMTLFDFIREPFWWPYPYDHADGKAVKNVTFYPQLKYGLDLQFCVAAMKIGVQPWLNGNVKLGHVIHERSVIRPPGMNQNDICPDCDTMRPFNPATNRQECPNCQR